MSTIVSLLCTFGLSAALFLYWPSGGRRTWFTRTLPLAALAGGVVGAITASIVPDSVYIGALPIDFFAGCVMPVLVSLYIANERSTQAYRVDLYAEDAEALLLRWFNQLPDGISITRSMITRRLEMGDKDAKVYQFILDSIVDIGHGIPVAPQVTVYSDYQFGTGTHGTTLTVYEINRDDVEGVDGFPSYSRRAVRQYSNWRRVSLRGNKRH